VNLILLFHDDFVSEDRVRLTGRRRDHVVAVHRVAVGDEMVVGLAGGKIGKGVVTGTEPFEMKIDLHDEPPLPLDVTLIVALPRPKVLNRVIAGATSMGVKRLYLINAWRVEKSYWKSPRLSVENLREQSILGLEQARDTVLPRIETRRLFRPFVEEELPSIIAGTRALVAHPYATAECPRGLTSLTLAIGPEGGFIAKEVESLVKVGFEPVSLGSRVLRVETAIGVLLGRLN